MITNVLYTVLALLAIGLIGGGTIYGFVWLFKKVMGFDE